MSEHNVADLALTKIFPDRCIKSIVLVTPPDVDQTLFSYTTCQRGRYSNYPPYGLGVLAANLRKLGIEVILVNLNNAVLRNAQESLSIDTFDFNDSWKTELHQILIRVNPDLIGVTCMFSQTHTSFHNVCCHIAKQFPPIPISVGGVHITNTIVTPDASERIYSDLECVDLFFKYECDVAFRQFVEIVNRTRDISEISQVDIRHNNSFLKFKNRSLPDSAELDLIPSHDLMNPKDMSRWGKVGAYTFLRDKSDIYSTILSNRGCRAQCTFCSVRNFNGVGVRRRSVQSVINELLMLRYEFDVDHIMWLDDDFLYDRHESLKLFNEMIRQQVDLTWDCTNGVIASSCTEELISAAQECGCLGLNIGMESGNPEILRQIRKPAAVKTLLRAAEVLRQFPRIFSRVFLIIGFPNETYGQILDTINVSREMALDWYQIQVLQPLPNTVIYEQMKAEGLFEDAEYENIRYSGGTYGKTAKVTESGRDMLDRDFKNIFDNKQLSHKVVSEDLEDIWSYMNFHLNYFKIPHEEREIKLAQYLDYLNHITNLIAPNDAMAHYYAGTIEKRIHGHAGVDRAAIIARMMDDSPYWVNRFSDFGLKLEDLKMTQGSH